MRHTTRAYLVFALAAGLLAASTPASAQVIEAEIGVSGMF